jgi:hypothetical protein
MFLPTLLLMTFGLGPLLLFSSRIADCSAIFLKLMAREFGLSRFWSYLLCSSTIVFSGLITSSCIGFWNTYDGTGIGSCS